MILREYFRKDNPFDYIVLGFIMKLLGVFAGFFIQHQIADAFFGVISWLLIIQGFVRIPGRLHFPFSNGYNLLFHFYLFLCFVMIVRGYLIDYPYQWKSWRSFISLHLFDSLYWLCYLMPFAVVIPLRYFNFRLMLLYSGFTVLLMTALVIAFRDQILMSSAMGAMGYDIGGEELVTADGIAFYRYIAFLPLFYYFLPRKQWLINMFGLALTVLLFIVGARRGGTLLMGILFLMSLNFYTLTKPNIVKWFSRILLIGIILLAVFYLVNSSLSDYLIERGMKDNRSGVEEGMLSQMNNFEMIFGKGLNGRYYYPLGLENDPYEGWRYGIETGFYNLVLKGGFLFAITYIILLAIPAIRGIVKSKNLFCKAGGFYILISLFNLWPFGLLSFDLSFLFIWMMVACCMNNTILRMSNKEIKQHFFYNLK